MRKTVFFLMMVLVIIQGRAQRTVISGIVVDEITNNPIAGASVTMEGLSVVTNDDGFFILKSDVASEFFMVSHVGYKSQQAKVDVGQLTIRLHPATIHLQEVLITAAHPRELVMAAISKIPVNYSQCPELYHCFYREKAMKRQHYISVAEGVTDMYKTGYQRGPVRRDRVAIRKGRRLQSPKQSDTLGVKVMAGPLAPIALDLVKNTDFLLNADELDLYDLTTESSTAIADRQQFVVNIRPRTTAPYALYSGKLYIDQQTLAFTRAELALDMSDREKATQAMLVRKPMGVRFRPKELSFVIDYRQGSDNLTRISYIRTTFRFNCDWKRRLFATSFAAFCEIAVTSITGEAVQPISGRESFDQRDAFFDKVDYFRDPTFWQDYNIIEPTESLDKAVGKLVKKYESTYKQ